MPNYNFSGLLPSNLSDQERELALKTAQASAPTPTKWQPHTTWGAAAQGIGALNNQLTLNALPKGGIQQRNMGAGDRATAISPTGNPQLGDTGTPPPVTSNVPGISVAPPGTGGQFQGPMPTGDANDGSVMPASFANPRYARPNAFALNANAGQPNPMGQPNSLASLAIMNGTPFLA
jgi:hypothetical protein